VDANRADTSPGRLVVTGLTKRFGFEPVLAGVDLTVEAGATVALLGPSGCGKTTLLRAIAGLEAPDSGSISLGARTLFDASDAVPPERRRIGMVFQDWALFPHLDVGTNVGYGLSRDDDVSRRVSEALSMVGLAGFERRMPSTLSGGQQQRVAIARAIAPRPAALLLDEPFSNLDAGLRIQVRSDTHRLLREIGMTTLFVTHDQAEAFVLGDEVAVMHHGIIRQQARPGTIYDRPADPWVAAFVGEANLFDGRAHGGVAVTAIGSVRLEGEGDGPVTVLIRPEQLQLTDGNDDPDATGAVSAVEFYGHDTSYRVVLEDAGIPATEIVVRAIAGPRFAPGDRVRVSFTGPPALTYPHPRAASPVPM
jgi:iron(III) transport system ATP-binding protein